GGCGEVVVDVGWLAEGMGPARWWCMWAAWLRGWVRPSGGVCGLPGWPGMGPAPAMAYLGRQQAWPIRLWVTHLGCRRAWPIRSGERSWAASGRRAIRPWPVPSDP